MVAAAGIAFARCDETIVFRAGFGFARLQGCNAHVQLPIYSEVYDAFACGSAVKPNSWVTRSNRLAVSPEISSLLPDSTSRMDVQAGATFGLA